MVDAYAAYAATLTRCHPAIRMSDLEQYIVAVPDFPRPGILFRDITPLLRHHFEATVTALDGLFSEAAWSSFDVVAGVESRGFILAAALAAKRGKGFVPVRKEGKLPPPVVDVAYDLEYGSGVLEMQRGTGRLLLVDDVLATGGTLRASADLCSAAGYRVSALGVLIDLRLCPDFVWQDLATQSVIRYG
jgi:adenine phosphoribosyltransferase